MNPTFEKCRSPRRRPSQFRPRPVTISQPRVVVVRPIMMSAFPTISTRGKMTWRFRGIDGRDGFQRCHDACRMD